MKKNDEREWIYNTLGSLYYNTYGERIPVLQNQSYTGPMIISVYDFALRNEWIKPYPGVSLTFKGLFAYFHLRKMEKSARIRWIRRKLREYEKSQPKSIYK